jgi:hypothetical protein
MRGRIPVAAVFALVFAFGGCAPAHKTTPMSTADPMTVDEPAAAACEPVPDEDARVALARTAVALGYPGLADEILSESGELPAVTGEDNLLARSLFTRGFLAWQAGNQDQASSLIEAARQADPFGPLAEPAGLFIELLDRLSQKELELGEMRERLAASEEQVDVWEKRSRTLEGEMKALREQLDELKQIHLRVESEKDDSP